MFVATGPSISANGVQVTADMSGPSTLNQPQAVAAELAARGGSFQSAVAAVQETNPAFDTQDRLAALGLAAGIGGPSAASSQAASSPTPEATATPTAAELCEPAANGLYCVYTVKAGDTLSGIASRFGIKASGDLSPAEILAQSNKPAVVESNSIETGLKLRIPSVNGVIHTVFSNETLSDIAKIYGVSPDAITALALNGIDASGSLRVGQNIIVPDPQQVVRAAAAPPTPTPEPSPTSVPTEAPPTATPEASSTPEPAAAAATATPRRASATATPTAARGNTPSRAGFIWPASGPISSYFGPSHPLGIDIDFYANPNQPVVAAAAGTVTFAGGDPCCSYGYYVLVDHGNGFETLYAHFSRIAVTTGQKVTQGQTLGYGGRTGYATGDHLHFEVHYNGAIVNPLNYLP